SAPSAGTNMHEMSPADFRRSNTNSIRNLFLVIFLFFSFPVYSQNKNYTDYKSQKITVEKSGSFNPRSSGDDWMYSLQNLEAPKPGGNSMREILAAKKQLQSQKYPRKSQTPNLKSSRATDPTTGSMFEGNIYNGSVPNDNDIAVSDDGYLISVSNTVVYAWDLVNDTLIMQKSLTSFMQPLNLSTLYSKYDPKVVYDYYAQRFVIVFLYGTTYQSSKVIVAFSSSTNPLDPWNLYALPGNPLLNDTWSDYPVIGISQFDLFIGINTFFNGSQNNSGFHQSCFWQVELQNGYADSATLNTAYYYDILAPVDTIFNITPVHKGGENNNSDMFLLSNENVSAISDTFYVLHVTDNLASGNATLQTQLVRSDKTYFLPVDAQQPSGHTLDANDARIYGAFQMNDKIQFVHGTLDTATGTDAIYHGLIENIYGTPVITGNIISDTVLDYGYPNIAWTGIYPNEGRSIIAFNHTGANVNPGFSCIAFADDSTYSNRVQLKAGTTYVNVLTGTYERWGDYTGIQRRYNESCKVWAAGTWGKLNGGNRINGTWIAEIKSEDTCQFNPSIGVSEISETNDALIYPNPAEDMVNIVFEIDQSEEIYIDITDLQGKLVKRLGNGTVKTGKNQLQFSTEPMSNGIYLLRIYSENKVFVNEKLVVFRQ
ncbi:MAG: T9SS type A sorting domain-containing protein, partial [Bacteroidota bacterium]